MYGNELYHHGILGMKWGVRRYQNKDGSLTSEGKERYSDGTLSKIAPGIAARKFETQTKKEYRKNIKSGMDKNEAKKIRNEAYNLYNKEALKKTSYKTEGIRALSMVGIGALSYGAGKALEASGKDMAGAILQGAGKGFAIGGLAGSAINAGMKWAMEHNN